MNFKHKREREGSAKKGRQVVFTMSYFGRQHIEFCLDAQEFFALLISYSQAEVIRPRWSEDRQPFYCSISKVPRLVATGASHAQILRTVIQGHSMEVHSKVQRTTINLLPYLQDWINNKQQRAKQKGKNKWVYERMKLE